MIANGNIEAHNQQLQVVKATQTTLDAHWPWLRERLLDIKASGEYPRLGDRRKVNRAELAVTLGQSGRCRWQPEQVRWAIMKGFHGGTTAELFYVLDEHQEIRGFLVTLTNPDPVAGVPLDFILWLVWAGSAHVLEAASDMIDDLARERGCTAIEHSSPREGWWRRQSKLGNWQLKYVTWRKNLI